MSPRTPGARRGVPVTLAGVLAVAAVLVGGRARAAERLPRALEMAARYLLPGYEVRIGEAHLRGVGHLELIHVRVWSRGGPSPLLRAKRIAVRSSPWAFLRERRVDEVRVVAPVVSLPGALPETSGGRGGGGGRAWSVGRLVVGKGRFRMAPAGERPGLAFAFGLDLRDLGTDPDLADRSHRVALLDVRATLGKDPPAVMADALLATFTVGGLLERRTLDEVRAKRLVLALPETLPASPATAPGPGDSGWRIGRLVAHDGRFQMAAAGERPGAAFGFGLDLRDLGLHPERAERPQLVRVHDVRVALEGRPPSLVLDRARVEFSLGELVERRRLARVLVDGGTLVVDRALRGRVAAGEGGTAGAEAGAWTLGELNVDRLGIRVSDLGEGIPDVTLRFRTTLTDVPLSPAGLALARDPQRVELSELSLYSPVDPFRQVIGIGSIFVDFSLAGLLREEIAGLALLSPTIYLGEDLIWYMNAARSQTAAAPAANQWTVGSVRAELGRIMFTFNGTDRLALPVTFHTQARNVALGDLATLRLAAELRVPRQSYTIPGFDLDLVDLHGDLRFDYPRGKARDNVVNVLEVAQIRWRDYRIEQGWLSLTFDERGINGELGGQAYAGYVKSGLSVPFGTDAPWSGWLSGTDLDLGRLAAAVASGRVEMTGAADLQAVLELRNGRLDRAEGHLVLDRPGRVSFPALDTLLANLPPDAPAWRRDLARIGVETFRDYPYAHGEGRLDFADSRGEARLELTGERGARRVEAHYYEDVPLVARVARTAE